MQFMQQANAILLLIKDLMTLLDNNKDDQSLEVVSARLVMCTD